MMNKTFALTLAGLLISFSVLAAGQIGHTEIAKWQYGKNGAVSLTYDDGSINQFRVAVPIMDSLGLPATFFIITGEMPGARYTVLSLAVPPKGSLKRQPRYRPIKTIFLNGHRQSAFWAIAKRANPRPRLANFMMRATNSKRRIW